MINQPPLKQTVEEETEVIEGQETVVKRFIRKGWAQFFSSVFTICFAQQQSGTTANRPVKSLYVGRRYYDTTLGIPIWYDANSSTGWANATGTAV